MNIEAYRAELEAAYQRALDRFGGPANAGDTDAMVTLGLVHEMRGDSDEAVRWWERAADRGSGAAAGILTVVFEDLGEDVRAEHWRGRAAELGEGTPSAMRDHADFLRGRGRSEEGMELHRRAAEAGDVASMCTLAELAEDRGDLAEAETWFRRAAEAGHPGAQEDLDGLL